jgi:glyoxylase-like metal-dependent hydrolase (beta-lactamase superfamily II)
MTLSGTNTWVLRTNGSVVIVDPGPSHMGHVEALRAYAIDAVLLTHRHADHTDALSQLADSVPVYAADDTMARGTIPLRGGELLRLNGCEIRVIATPGRTNHSLCFEIPAASEGSVLLTGDTILGGRTSTLVSPISGDLAALLRSLDALSAKSLSNVRGLPGHGEPFANVAAHAMAALQHRRRRLTELERLLRGNPKLSLAEIAKIRHPSDSVLQRASRSMLEIERQHLRMTGRLES